VLYKQRGIGMFVASGARQALLKERRAAFSDTYLEPLVAEAHKLGLSADDLAALINQRFSERTAG